MIPPDAKVCAQSLIHPHLAYRNNIYLFPYNMQQAEYIFLFKERDYWPILNEEDFKSHIASLQADSSLKQIFNEKGLLLFKRR